MNHNINVNICAHWGVKRKTSVRRRGQLQVEELERRDLLNAAPTLDGLLLNNYLPQTTDVVQVQVVDAVDPDGDLLSFQYDWRVNGQTVQTTTSSSPFDTLDLSQPGFGDRGDLIEVFVTISDGNDTTSAMASLTVAAAPSELYADCQLAVSQADQVYLDTVGATWPGVMRPLRQRGRTQRRRRRRCTTVTNKQ